MATTVEAHEEFYKRRLDRSPEKPEFYRLPVQDRQLICGLRTAMENTRSKFDRIRDEMDDKDRDINREQALRKAAEARLEQMVDMYASPDVNQELRDRLPRASKDDPKLKFYSHNPEGVDNGVSEGIITKETETQNNAERNSRASSRQPRRSLIAEIEGQIIPGASDDEATTSPRGRRSRSASTGRDSSKKGKHRSNKSHDSDLCESDEDDSSQHSQRKHRSRSAHSHPPAGYPSPPYPGYPGPMYSPYPAMAPMMYTPTPQMMPQMMSPMGGPVVPMAQSTPMAYNMQTPVQHVGHYVSTPGQQAPVQGMMPAQHGQYMNSQGLPIAAQGQNMSAVGPLDPNQRSRLSPSKMVVVNGQEVPVYSAGQQAPPSSHMINPSSIPSNQISATGEAISPLQSGGVYSGNQSGPFQHMTSPSLGLNPQYSRARRLSDPLLEVGDSELPVGGAIGVLGSTMKPSVSTPNLLGVGRDANVVCREHNRQISLLLAELNAAKDLNKKLSERLSEAERELESLKLADKTRGATMQAEVAGKAAALVEEIYRAQKQRDGAIMSRLRLANEERDEALSRLKQSQNEKDQMNNEDAALNMSDPNMSALLSRLTTSDSPSRIEKSAGILVDRIQQMRDRKKQITMEEMRAVLQERDLIMAKYKKVEQELMKLRRHGEPKVDNKGTEQLLQAKLLATQQERDMALARTKKLEEEIQTLRVYYSLHKSLSQEANLRDQFNNSLENMDLQLKQRDSMVDLAQKENNQLLAQLKSALAEKSLLQQELSKSNMAASSQHALTAAHCSSTAVCNNCEKMERLVNVLRRKINGLGSKVDE